MKLRRLIKILHRIERELRLEYKRKQTGVRTPEIALWAAESIHEQVKLIRERKRP